MNVSLSYLLCRIAPFEETLHTHSAHITLGRAQKFSRGQSKNRRPSTRICLFILPESLLHSLLPFFRSEVAAIRARGVKSCPSHCSFSLKEEFIKWGIAIIRRCVCVLERESQRREIRVDAIAAPKSQKNHARCTHTNSSSSHWYVQQRQYYERDHNGKNCAWTGDFPWDGILLLWSWWVFSLSANISWRVGNNSVYYTHKRTFPPSLLTGEGEKSPCLLACLLQVNKSSLYQ